MPNSMRFMQENVVHIAPIFAVGVVAVAIVIERVRALFWVYPLQGSAGFYEAIRTLILTDRVSEAIVLCDKYKRKPVAGVVREGLLRAHQPEAVVEHGLEIAVGEAMERIRARTGFLSAIANVATLLGLLGTILGLVRSFEAVGNASAQTRAAMLTSGISTAMNATMCGLAVAIPCIMAYTLLMNRTNRLTAEVHRSAIRVMDLLKQRYFSSAASTSSGSGSGLESNLKDKVGVEPLTASREPAVPAAKGRSARGGGVA